MAIQTGFNDRDRKYGSYNSFGGSDITAVIGNTMLGTLQAISYSVTREKGPIYTMRGSADPLAFARGKRAIAGSLVFLTIDEQSLLKHAEETNKNMFYGSMSDVRYESNDDLSTLESLFEPSDVSEDANFGQQTYVRQSLPAVYADQLVPFDVHVIASNEMGDGMKKIFIGVEILNEGGGVSIDDLVIEEQYTYICRSLTKWKKVNS